MEEQPHQRFEEYFCTDPPAILYHYTGQSGLIGIVEKAELWATKIQYMNDATEFGLALGMMRERLEYVLNNSKNSMEEAAAAKLRDSIGGIEDINIFATCFCEDGDLLSQWRGYSVGRYGYAIGFDSHALKSVADRSKFILGPCIYDLEMQRKIVEQAIAQCIKDEMDFTAFKRWGFHGPLAGILFRYGVFFKDASFKAEREWRLVSPTVRYHEDNFQFRVGNSMISPFYTLSTRNETPPIKHVVIGPCPHMALSKSAVTSLLMRHGNLGPLRGELVAIGSKIPFRVW